MVRSVAAFLLLVSVASAHGGAFRPPPGQRPGDPFRPSTPRGRTTTAAVKGSAVMVPWEIWWYFNREPYLRIRERIAERRVVSGEGEGRVEFDRRMLRETVLAPLLLEALRDEDEEVRTSAAVALGKLRISGAVEPLKRLFRRDRQKQVREAAMVGLLLARDPALAPFFREVALEESCEGRLRSFAFLGLGLLGDCDFLGKALFDGETALHCGRGDLNEFHACAAFGLGLVKDAGAIPPLVRALGDRESHVAARGFAGPSLGRQRDPVSLPDVWTLLGNREEDGVARVGAAIAIGSLVPGDDEERIGVLGRKALRDGHGGVRTHLAISLGRIGGERAALHLAAGLRECQQAERGFFLLGLGLCGTKEAAEILLEEFDRIRVANDRGACAIALALAGAKDAIPKIHAAVEDGAAGFLAHGVMALGILDDPKGADLVEHHLEEASEADVRRDGTLAYALLRRSGAVPALVKRMQKAKSTLERGALAHALGLVGEQSAVDALLKLFHDTTRQGEERAIVLAALGRIADAETPPLLAQLCVDINLYVICDAVGELLTIL